MIISKERFDAEKRMYINLRLAHPEWSEQKIRDKIYKSFYRNTNYREVTKAENLIMITCIAVAFTFGIIQYIG